MTTRGTLSLSSIGPEGVRTEGYRKVTDEGKQRDSILNTSVGEWKGGAYCKKGTGGTFKGFHTLSTGGGDGETEQSKH